jgi:hypothetical protein
VALVCLHHPALWMGYQLGTARVGLLVCISNGCVWSVQASGGSKMLKRWAVIRRRPCWYSPNQHKRVVCATWAEAEELKKQRCIYMLRRATFNHYFSARQVDLLLRMVPACARLPGLIALWSTVSARSAPFASPQLHCSGPNRGGSMVGRSKI